jgi:hypothetical protein
MNYLQIELTIRCYKHQSLFDYAQSDNTVRVIAGLEVHIISKLLWCKQDGNKKGCPEISGQPFSDKN